MVIFSCSGLVNSNFSKNLKVDCRRKNDVLGYKILGGMAELSLNDIMNKSEISTVDALFNKECLV